MSEAVVKIIQRKMPIGSEIIPGGVHFRVWAPLSKSVSIIFEDENIPSVALTKEKNEYFSGISNLANEGTLYKIKLEESDDLYPDPASRFQPAGPHGPSQVVDLTRFNWTDADWKGINLPGQIIYEMHIGTFTREGTYLSAADQLEALKELGITVIEIMPLADFPGRFGWGYDGVNLFAPSHLYGTPYDLCELINRAHLHGIAVILDVVYNHLGPDGNYLGKFSPYYFSSKYQTEWGEALNFDGENSEPVREYFISNASYWIEEYHFDGLRLDATQSIFDNSSNHILRDISRIIRKNKAGRNVISIAENEPQNVKLLTNSASGGYEIDGLWNDDFHHSAMVNLTGRNEAYYTDYLGTAQEFISSAKYGFLYQGQRYKWQKNRRGSPTRGIKPGSFINFIQNHDQVANSGRGLYCHQHSSFGCFKAMSALLLILPQTPMIFQGQEFAASNSFFYFADHPKELAELVAKGRAEFLSQFRSLALPETQAWLPDPGKIETFINSKLDFNERISNHEIYSLYKDLIKLRKQDQVISRQAIGGIDGAVLADGAFILRFFSDDLIDRLLVVNFGRDLHLDPAPEPLLAPPLGYEWDIIFSTEDLKYGGIGTAPLDTDENWKLPGRSAIVLMPIKQKENSLERK